MLRTFPLAGVLLLIAGATALIGQTKSVTGEVTCRQRIALPHDSVVTVQLEDVSRADAPATVVTQKEIKTGGKQVPISFKLPYSQTDIDPSHRYQVRASIHGEGRLLFSSTTAYPVITNGAPSKVSILLEPVSAQNSMAPPVKAPRSAIDLTDTHWRLIGLENAPVTIGPNAKEAFLTFTAEGHRVAGSGGCNRIIGSYSLEGDSLHLGQLGTTMMACPDPQMQLETKFLDEMKRVSKYSIEGNKLQLFDDSHQLVARFMAITDAQ